VLLDKENNPNKQYTSFSEEMSYNNRFSGPPAPKQKIKEVSKIARMLQRDEKRNKRIKEALEKQLIEKAKGVHTKLKVPVKKDFFTVTYKKKK
jgi:hypothetical protein